MSKNQIRFILHIFWKLFSYIFIGSHFLFLLSIYLQIGSINTLENMSRWIVMNRWIIFMMEKFLFSKKISCFFKVLNIWIHIYVSWVINHCSLSVNIVFVSRYFIFLKWWLFKLFKKWGWNILISCNYLFLFLLYLIFHFFILNFKWAHFLNLIFIFSKFFNFLF